MLLDEYGKPSGGQWNFDHENRKQLPNSHTVPSIPSVKQSKVNKEVITLVNDMFDVHPGDLKQIWLPTNRAGSIDWLNDFVTNRLHHFGDYEDAMRKDETLLYHSALSALLNVGLLHPKEVVDKVVKSNVAINNKEGFVRQLIGWREFMFGLYHHRYSEQKQDNFFNNTKRIPQWLWELDDSLAPEPPLANTLKRLRQTGYLHHIERLMILGNYMLVSQYNPSEVYEWFMVMFVDAHEWVMAPNVIGMSQYADGGVDGSGFATKPYISGSNYLQKMGKWWPSQQAAKDSEWTKLYWQFLDDNYDKLQNNYRLKPLYTRHKKRQKASK